MMEYDIDSGFGSRSNRVSSIWATQEEQWRLGIRKVVRVVDVVTGTFATEDAMNNVRDQSRDTGWQMKERSPEEAMSL